MLDEYVFQNVYDQPKMRGGLQRGLQGKEGCGSLLLSSPVPCSLLLRFVPSLQNKTEMHACISRCRLACIHSHLDHTSDVEKAEPPCSMYSSIHYAAPSPRTLHNDYPTLTLTLTVPRAHLTLLARLAWGCLNSSEPCCLDLARLGRVSSGEKS